MKKVQYLITACAAVLLMVACETEQVKMTDSGYEYVSCVDAEGDPGSPGDWVFIRFIGYAGDSVILDNREDEQATPIQLPQGDQSRDQLSPLQDVLSNMSIGDSVRFDYPIDSFKVEPPNLPEGVDALTYHIKVEDIMSSTEFQEWRSGEMKKIEEQFNEIQQEVEQLYSDYKAGNLDIQRTESGLGYIIHKEGTGSTPETGQVVNAHYYGMLAEDGEMFDNSYQRGRPFSFQLGMGMVIPAWDEGFAMLKPGAEATLFVPAELGYGERGSPPVIPPNAELIFDVKLESVR